MQFIPARITTGRSASLAAAVALTLSALGCQGGGSTANDTMGGGSNNSGGGTTMVSDKNGNSASSTNGDAAGSKPMAMAPGMVGGTQYFPLGTLNREVIKMDVAGPTSIKMNQPATYQITLTNMTENAVHHLVLLSTNPDGFQVTSAAPAHDPADGQGGRLLGRRPGVQGVHYRHPGRHGE